MRGENESFTFELDFPERSEDDKHCFVHRLWAGRKVDFLLSEIRKHDDPPEELVTEVTRLAKRYGIVTPYTSYLMTDDVIHRRERELTERLERRVSDFSVPSRSGRSSPDEASKQRSVAGARVLNQQRRLQSESGGLNAFYGGFGVIEENDEAADALGELAPAEKRPALAALRHIGTRTFYQSKADQTWYESEFDPQRTSIDRRIKIGSDDYVNLLLEDSRLAKFFALGNVVLQVKGEWLRIESDGS
jgi:Ca-activated chloride channel family protein